MKNQSVMSLVIKISIKSIFLSSQHRILAQSLQIYYSFQYVVYPLVSTDPTLDPLQLRLSNVVQ